VHLWEGGARTSRVPVNTPHHLGGRRYVFDPMPNRRNQHRPLPQRLAPWLALAVAAGTVLSQLAGLVKLALEIIRHP